MNEPQPVSLKDRLRALLAIPDSQRTDAEWDELNEIEITLASSNQLSNPEPGPRRNGPTGSGHPRPAGAGQNKKPFRKFRKRPPKEGGGP